MQATLTADPNTTAHYQSLDAMRTARLDLIDKLEGTCNPFMHPTIKALEAAIEATEAVLRLPRD